MGLRKPFTFAADLTCYQIFDQVRKESHATVIEAQDLQTGDLILATVEGMGVPCPQLVISVNLAPFKDLAVYSIGVGGAYTTYTSKKQLCAVFQRASDG